MSYTFQKTTYCYQQTPFQSLKNRCSGFNFYSHPVAFCSAFPNYRAGLSLYFSEIANVRNTLFFAH
ncbi:hypothetical protein VCRA2117O376_160027 [Vibrio crassostreae]|nr:hypothetical protein VCRA2117O376_160027 [Vibrio crassostreae]CAK1790688.1 hypothetical protein VCRA2113O199_160028 [Vibrio crassostreae]CAK1797320.1 hypothetical protein VCRA2113O362_160104 [Vibrio crassostreae]CAK1805756.1 hypothetical protein VCRA2113O363_170028 [Vibrio crassostreae]CAK1812496.1 hypothetical protein VCRA2113O359_170103 [Vibrio crassostreae]